MVLAGAAVRLLARSPLEQPLVSRNRMREPSAGSTMVGAPRIHFSLCSRLRSARSSFLGTSTAGTLDPGYRIEQAENLIPYYDYLLKRQFSRLCTIFATLENSRCFL